MLAQEGDREQLARLVQQWNENRLDLFHLSYPTEDLEIEGVMRFYFQDSAERVLTKCVRVSSTATTRAVIEALSDKFLPDLKMLTDNKYSLWEVHENGSERRLDDNEKPLLVQLNWHRDDREGRFLLRRENSNFTPLSTIQLSQDNNLPREARYSKRDKKETKKKSKDIVKVNEGREEPNFTGDIYRQVPQNTFTRTISNPEAVMRKKREQKLEAKLKQMGLGGSLKIYGGDLVPSRPYVTVLVSVDDRAERLLSEVVEKYGLDNSMGDFVLAEYPVPGGRSQLPVDGRIVHPHEFPLQTMTMSENGPDTYLALRRTPSDYASTNTVTSMGSFSYQPTTNTLCTDPALLILQSDGQPTNPPQWVTIRSGVTEVGSDRALEHYSQHAQNIFIEGPGVCGRHCVITYMERVVTITPSSSDARIEINGNRILQTQILSHGDVIVIGRAAVFRFSSDKTLPDDLTVPDYSRLTPLCNSLSASSSSRHSSDQMEPRNGPRPPSGYTALPVSLQIGDYKVWDYLVEVMSRGFPDAVSFRLAPAYALYFALKFFHSHSKPYLVQFFKRIDHHVGQISQECTNRDELLFWLANASEFSFLVDHSPDLRLPRSGNLPTMVESIFRRLCTVLVGALRPVCQSVLDVNVSNEVAIRDLLALLNSTLRSARSCRLNPALTIQLSGHMFHAINAAIFNGLVGSGTTSISLTTRLGQALLQRLDEIHGWAEQMGVELAAECHLDRCRQAAILLSSQKNDVAALGATCYKLNSLQVKHLLTRFHVENGEIPCDSDVISRVAGLAERQADQLTIQDGLPLTLEETDALTLPFMLPQDAYVAENLRSVPDGLAQYLFALETKGLCHSVSLTDQSALQQQSSQPAVSAPMQRSASQSTLTSTQTTQFGDSFGSTGDDIIRVTLHRGSGGIGLSIVAAQGIGDRQTGIYVKKVVEGSPAAKDGRLARGDQLLSVNRQSLLAITQEDAAVFMSRSGPEVTFEVRKGAANRNGLSQWLDGERPLEQKKTSNVMSQSLHSTLSDTHDLNYSSISKYDYRTSVQPSPVQPPPYQPRPQQIQTSRGSAFAPPAAEPVRHMRSISASELYQNDPNATMSQRSIAGSVSGFDRLPAHYRQSHRPVVVQPGRTCPSPTAMRRNAQSPGLYRPPSATNLFAPSKSPNLLQQVGYSSTSTRASQLDIYRAVSGSSKNPGEHEHVQGTASTPPQAQSSPIMSPAFSSSLPAPLTQHNSNVNYSSNASLPRPAPRPVSVHVNGNTYPPIRQEPIIVRPADLGMTGMEERGPASVRGGVPTAITQALALQAAKAGGAPSRVARPTSRPLMEDPADIRELEQRTQHLMTRESVEEELDRLDTKGINMTEEETRRYRELLNMAAEQSRQRVAVQSAVTQKRTETVIDDFPSSTASTSIATSPSTARNAPRSVHFEHNSPGEVDSPGIVGANEVYRDPRQRRLNEIQDKRGPVTDGARLDFRDKMRLFAHQIGEDTPKQRAHASSAQRHIEQEQ